MRSSALIKAAPDCCSRKRLAVLIPAYEYAEGVRHILDSLAEAPADLIECIIADDSQTDAVEKVVRAHLVGARVTYRRNRPAAGAVCNWNSLLSEAEADFVMLLHHDEWPVEKNFFKILCAKLVSDIDALVLDCYVTAAGRTKMRRHVPLTAKALVIKYAPGYLLRRNVLGAPSVFVVRREKVMYFDARISWLVDVEWYVRHLRQRKLSLQISGDLSLLSLPHARSITASLGMQLRTLRWSESRLLAREQPSEWALRLNAPDNAVYRIFHIFESVIWAVVRASMRIVTRLSAREIPVRLRTRDFAQ